MSEIWVAYNSYGDLIAEGSSQEKVVEQADFFGYDEDEIIIGKVTP